MIDEEGSIRQAILCILSTATGERVMRPEYGCDLDRLMFMQSDETLLGLAIHLVRKALERWEPRIEIEKLDAEFNKNEPGRLDILLDYRVRSTASADSLMVPINLS
jgi:phage baseplate assembly protein W